MLDIIEATGRPDLVLAAVSGFAAWIIVAMVKAIFLIALA
jgi:hypothetical protein